MKDFMLDLVTKAQDLETAKNLIPIGKVDDIWFYDGEIRICISELKTIAKIIGVELDEDALGKGFHYGGAWWYERTKDEYI